MNRACKFFIVFLCTILSAQLSFAGIGATVTGRGVSTIGGPIATQADMLAGFSSTEEAIAYWGKVLQERMEKNTEAINQAAQAIVQAINESSKRELIAQEALESEKTWGSAAQIDDTCCLKDIAAGTMQAGQVAEDVKAGLKVAFTKYGRSFNNEFEVIEARKKFDTEDLNFFPEGKTYTTEELEKAKEATKFILNPNPILNLDESAIKDSTAAESYEALRKVRETVLQTASEVFNHHNAMYTGSTALAPVLQEMWTVAGGDGTPPAINPEGKVSYYGLMETMAKRRVESYNWMKNLSGKGDTALLKEIAIVASLELRVQWEILDKLDKMAMQNAFGTSMNIQDVIDPKLNVYRSLAISGASK